MSKTYFNISDKLRLYEFDGMLDQYGDAAAAYSLRKLRNGYTGDAIRVRRSSDNTERDMGFYDNELDTVALLNWVNADYVRYQSDFRASSPYTQYSANVTTSVGESIDGVDDAMKVTLTGGNTNHDICPILNATSFLGQQVTFEFDYYIPSSNALVDNLFNQNTFSSVTSSTSNLDVLDAWTSVVIEGVTKFAPENIDTFIRARANTSQTFDADGDVFYLKNIRIIQLTADGHVQTWYDQSANANHAVQGTATAQPKIVDAGALVTVNGKPAILGDGVDDNISSTNVGTFPSPLTVAAVYDSVVENGYLGGVFSGANNGPGFLLNYANAGFTAYQQGPALTPGVLTPNQSLMFFKSSTTGIDWKLYINSAEILNSGEDIGASVGDKITLFSRGNSISFSNANIQEFIVYGSDNTSMRTDIETNINTHYSIY